MNKLFVVILLALISSIATKGRAPDIVAVKGDSVFENTKIAVETLGGMERFVQPGNTVGILVNSGFREKGAYVDPDVVIAALLMIFDAGATDVVFLQHIIPEYWQRSGLYDEYKEVINKTRTIEANHFPSEFDDENFQVVKDVKGAKAISWELEVVKEFFNVDVFINIPIAKHHSLTVLTNAMKNMMGINTRASNVKFHLEGPERNDPHFLAQSIVDLNLLRKPDLIISDVSHVITTNGPGGPGEIVSPMKVVAGTDPVAVDKYCAIQVGFFAEDVLTIKKGYEAGLGYKDLDRINIVEIPK